MDLRHVLFPVHRVFNTLCLEKLGAYVPLTLLCNLGMVHCQHDLGGIAGNRHDLGKMPLIDFSI